MSNIKIINGLPALSDEFIERMNQFEHYHSGAICTCNECPKEMGCKYSWDLYNKDGDCLAEK
jgi:hypothetical protein